MSEEKREIINNDEKAEAAEKTEKTNGAGIRAFFEILKDHTAVITVILFAVLSGGIFFRLMYMGGVPVWFLIIQGLLFAGSFMQSVYFLVVGLPKLIHNLKDRKDR